MPLRRTLRSWLRRDSVPRRTTIDTETVIHAHGQCLALIATILERERLLAAGDLASALGCFAAVTSSDHPDRARLLRLWATYVEEAAAAPETVSASDPPEGIG